MFERRGADPGHDDAKAVDCLVDSIYSTPALRAMTQNARTAVFLIVTVHEDIVNRFSAWPSILKAQATSIVTRVAAKYISQNRLGLLNEEQSRGLAAVTLDVLTGQTRDDPLDADLTRYESMAVQYGLLTYNVESFLNPKTSKKEWKLCDGEDRKFTTNAALLTVVVVLLFPMLLPQHGAVGWSQLESLAALQQVFFKVADHIERLNVAAPEKSNEELLSAIGRSLDKRHRSLAALDALPSHRVISKCTTWPPPSRRRIRNQSTQRVRIQQPNVSLPKFHCLVTPTISSIIASSLTAIGPLLSTCSLPAPESRPSPQRKRTKQSVRRRIGIRQIRVAEAPALRENGRCCHVEESR